MSTRRPRHRVAMLLAIAAPMVAACECGGDGVDRSDGTVPELVAHRSGDDRIELDGRLDDDPWERTGTTGPFVSPSTDALA